MTELEKRQEKEIARLQQKIKNLSQTYEKTLQELEHLKCQKPQPRPKGRPGVDTKTRAHVLSLCRQGKTMREIGLEVGLASSTVHKIITEASREARVLYIFMDREMPGTILDVCGITQRIKIVNLTDQIASRAFGVIEKPDWEDYQKFLESRRMPGTRYGIQEELQNLGVDAHDPFRTVEKTEERAHGDGQWLKRMSKEWGAQLDEVMKETKKKPKEERRKRLLELLARSGGQERETGRE